MTVSAGTFNCPPYIADQEIHRMEIARWMARIQPTIDVAASLSAGSVSQPWIIATNTPYSAPTDGVTDVRPALSAAAASFGSAGGVIILPAVGSYLLDSTFTLPRNVTLRGTRITNGMPGNNAATDFNIAGRMYINTGATVRMKGNTGIEGLFMLRKSMTIPSNDASAFSGVAITVQEDDALIRSNMIIGFNIGVFGTAVQRTVVHHCNFDNINNVWLEQVADVCKIHNNHAWPFATVGGAGGTSGLHRSGTSFNLRNLNDWAKLADNFCYGYYRGYQLIDVANVTMTGCGADNTQANTGSMGFEIKGNCPSTVMIGCQAAGQDYGLHVSTSSTWLTMVQNFSAWGIVKDCILADKGIVHVNNSWLRSGSYGVVVNFANAGAFLASNTYFENNAVQPLFANFSTSSVTLHNCRFLATTAAPVNTLCVLPDLSVSATIAPLMSYSVHDLRGSGTVETVLGGWPGRQMTLKVNSNVVTFKHGTPLNLNGAASFVASVGATLTITSDGSNWYEIGRKT